jgi:hypothetical protein
MKSTLQTAAANYRSMIEHGITPEVMRDYLRKCVDRDREEYLLLMRVMSADDRIKHETEILNAETMLSHITNACLFKSFT